MLGVFGNVPAFDTYFRAGFRAATFGPKAFDRLGSRTCHTADATQIIPICAPCLMTAVSLVAAPNGGSSR